MCTGIAQVSSPDKVENMVNAAYASTGNDHYDKPFSLWPYGNVRSGDAYKVAVMRATFIKILYFIGDIQECKI